MKTTIKLDTDHFFSQTILHAALEIKKANPFSCFSEILKELVGGVVEHFEFKE